MRGGWKGQRKFPGWIFIPTISLSAVASGVRTLLLLSSPPAPVLVVVVRSCFDLASASPSPSSATERNEGGRFERVRERVDVCDEFFLDRVAIAGEKGSVKCAAHFGKPWDNWFMGLKKNGFHRKLAALSVRKGGKRSRN